LGARARAPVVEGSRPWGLVVAVGTAWLQAQGAGRGRGGTGHRAVGGTLVPRSAAWAGRTAALRDLAPSGVIPRALAALPLLPPLWAAEGRHGPQRAGRACEV
jgi:hypothetical protein